jgi:thioester reductase-like protein
VNWLARYDAVRGANVLGTEALLRHAASGAGTAFHHVSTISTAPLAGDEGSLLSFDEAAASSGYALSKWVAECVVRSAQSEGAPVVVHRPGLITGHHRRGIGNPGDFVHRYLRACRDYGVFLDQPEHLDMTPVDYVARGIVAAVLDPAHAPPVTHLCNVHASPSFAAAGKAVAGSAPRGLDYEAFRRAAVLPPESPLRALASYFPPGHFGLGSGPWPDAKTRTWLALRGVVCPAVDAEVLARYGARL